MTICDTTSQEHPKHQKNNNPLLIDDCAKRQWQSTIEAKPGSGVAFHLKDYYRNADQFNPSKQLYVVTGKPGSGKTQHLKLYIKTMIKALGAAVYIVDANPTFIFSPDYSNAYHNLIEEYYGKVFYAQHLDYKALIQVKTVAGIAVTSLIDDDKSELCANFIVQLATYLQETATQQNRRMVLVLENIQKLGLLQVAQARLLKLTKLINAHFYIAVSTSHPSNMRKINLPKDAFNIDNLERRRASKPLGDLS